MANVEQRCEICNAFLLIDGNNGVCRARPPQGFIIGMQPGKVKMQNGQQQMKPVVASVYPEVGKGDWCREFMKAPSSPSQKYPAFRMSEIAPVGAASPIHDNNSSDVS